MARAKVNRGLDSETAQQVMSMAVGAAEALVMGVGHVAERAIAETARAAEDVGTEVGAALARAARGSVRARESGGDLVHSDEPSRAIIRSSNFGLRRLQRAQKLTELGSKPR